MLIPEKALNGLIGCPPIPLTLRAVTEMAQEPAPGPGRRDLSRTGVVMVPDGGKIRAEVSPTQGAGSSVKVFIPREPPERLTFPLPVLVGRLQVFLLQPVELFRGRHEELYHRWGCRECSAQASNPYQKDRHPRGIYSPRYSADSL